MIFSSKGKCLIDPSINCKYEQASYDPGNFIRNVRAKHSEKALEIGIMKAEDVVTEKPIIVPKRPIVIDQQLFIDSVIKIDSLHNFSLASLEWEGLKQLFDPIAEATGLTLNRSNTKTYLRSAAHKIRSAISNEMKNHLKVDSASKHHRHVLEVNSQYVLWDKVVIRALGEFV